MGEYLSGHMACVLAFRQRQLYALQNPENV
jgi:hypothetical protein